MSQRLKLEIKALSEITGPDVVVLLSDTLALPSAAEAFVGPETRTLLARAAKAERFEGKPYGALTLLAPEGAGFERLIAVGLGPEADRDTLDFVKLGGAIAGRLGRGRRADVVLALPEGEISPRQAADIALGLRLRAYTFDRYKTKTRKPEDA